MVEAAAVAPMLLDVVQGQVRAAEHFLADILGIAGVLPLESKKHDLMAIDRQGFHSFQQQSAPHVPEYGFMNDPDRDLFQLLANSS